MKKLILPAVFFLVLFFPFSVSAQPSRVAHMRQISATQPADQTQLTPLQLAELRGDIFMARKLYPQAIKTYKRLVRQEPKDAALLNKLGVAYDVWGNNGLAERYFKKAAKADKTYADAFNNVGTVEYAKHHYKGAIHWYEKSLKLQPEKAPFYSNLGYAYFGGKKYDLAMAAFEKAIEINPMIFQAQEEGGAVVQQRGTTDQGLFYFFIARTYAEIGNAERAAHYLKMARDDGYKKFTSAKTDPAFANVIKSPLVIAVFAPVPELAEKRR